MNPKPRGIHANFTSTCVMCGAEITVSNGKPDPHTCRVDLDAIHWPEPTV